MMRQYELVERVRAYDHTADEDSLNKAYVYAMRKHGAQMRASGDPYFSHPIEVAGILTRYKLDDASIICALLHDTVEDTDATLEEIENLFGEEVSRLVDGVTKLTRLQLTSDKSKQAENFRKLLLAMSTDIRVLLVKLADRVHNMQTLHYIKNPDKRRRIAMETMEIYAPLAERIGMQEIKQELEDRSFAELYADAHESIVNRLQYLKEHGGDLVKQVSAELKEILAKHDVQVVVSGREKTPYSIWRKMQQKDITFEQLSDIIAFRVVVPNETDCYRALGVIHAAYPMVPGRFKDYLSTPKPNGYSSIHTTVIGPYRHRVEIQIRTQEMHEIAELGVAAHWKYKQGGRNVDGRQYRWLRELLEIMEHAEGPEEFLEHTKLEMFQDQVFCFTPKGDLITLPGGATPIDFAYAVHTEVGDHCVGVRVNGRMVPLRTRLVNGDQVDVVTSKAQKPSPEWERFAVSGKARASIRRFMRSEARDQYLELGRQIVDKAFQHEGYTLNEKALDGILAKFQLEDRESLYVRVGEGSLTGRDIVTAVYPGLKRAGQQVAAFARNLVGKGTSKVTGKGKEQQKKKNAVALTGLIPGMAVHYARCCHPLPGDRIVGIVTTGKGVTVHTIDCDQLQNVADEPERWLDLSWDIEVAEDEPHIGRIDIVVGNEPGALGALSTEIARSKGNIINLKITSRSQDFFEMRVDVEVRDVQHLTDIIAALRATKGVNAVDRAKH